MKKYCIKCKKEWEYDVRDLRPSRSGNDTMLTLEICDNCGHEVEGTRRLTEDEKRTLNENSYDFQIKNSLSKKGYSLKCPICNKDDFKGKERLLVDNLKKELEEDFGIPEDGIMEFAVLTCQNCGYVLLFNSEKLELKPLFYGKFDEF